MAEARQENFEAEPAVQCKTANKELAVKNSRASGKWLRIRNTLEREKKDFENKINVDRAVLLKQRERLQVTTALNKTAPETSNQVREAVMGRRMTLTDVYDALMKAVKEEQKPNQGEDHKSVQSEPHRRRASTLSFDSKRVTRKPTYFSLQNLQRAQSSLQTRLQAIAQEQEHSTEENDETNEDTTATQLGPFDLNEEEKSLGPKLRLPPTGLPPIRSQNRYQPRARNFEKRRLQSCPDSCDLDEIKYCRYLRGRRNSAPTAVRPGMNLKHSTMNKRS